MSSSGQFPRASITGCTFGSAGGAVGRALGGGSSVFASDVFDARGSRTRTSGSGAAS
jgi:hypothetical protein